MSIISSSSKCMLNAYSTSITILIISKESTSKSKILVSGQISSAETLVRLEIISMILSNMICPPFNRSMLLYTFIVNFSRFFIKIIDFKAFFLYNSQKGVMKLTKIERLKNNATIVYRCIKYGAHTIQELLDKTAIGQYHLSNALDFLLELEIIKESQEKSNKQHRPLKLFTITKKYHTTYIERRGPNFLFISISPINECVNSAGFPAQYSFLNTSCTFDFFTRGIKRNKIYKYCNKIYLCSDYTDDVKAPDAIYKISRFDLITSSLLSTDAEIYIKYYGITYKIFEGKITEFEGSCDVPIISIDDNNIYDEIFAALARHTDKYVEEIIQNH